MNNNNFFYIALIGSIFIPHLASCMENVEDALEQQIQALQVQINKISFMIGGKKQQLSNVEKIQNNSYLFQQHFPTSGYSSTDEYSNYLSTRKKELKNIITEYQTLKESFEKDVEKLERKIDKMQTTSSTKLKRI